ncbi:MAG: PhzF family phenazine biosynthesis protein, partial [Acidobacteria bacterium]|nr:PhzF family phenazine biosynthesis protein [Acidobacteriota bacterium]
MPYGRNPLAVVHDGEGLSTEEMQRFATWTNLSETTFLLPPTTPDADYRVRIFTASQELPFAGHPTLGSAKAWLNAGGFTRPDGTVIQECQAGLIPIRVAGDQFVFEAPPLTRYEPVGEAKRTEITAALGIPAEQIIATSWLVNGPQWIGVRLATAKEVLALQPVASMGTDLKIGAVGPHEPNAETQFEVRGFIVGDTVREDPVTGSLNAGLARWLIDTEVATAAYIASQGTALGRHGRIHISSDLGTIWVGGHVTSC